MTGQRGFARSEKYKRVTVLFMGRHERSIKIRHEGEDHFIGLTLLSYQSANEIEAAGTGDMIEIEVMAWLADKIGLR